jgi:hypothetical protein
MLPPQEGYSKLFTVKRFVRGDESAGVIGIGFVKNDDYSGFLIRLAPVYSSLFFFAILLRVKLRRNQLRRNQLRITGRND